MMRPSASDVDCGREAAHFPIIIMDPTRYLGRRERIAWLTRGRWARAGSNHDGVALKR